MNDDEHCRELKEKVQTANGDVGGGFLTKCKLF